MSETVYIDDRPVGTPHPAYVIGEIGINHNGDLDIAKRLIDAAVAAGCDAVKFQKRTPEICVPEEQKHVERDTPWGRLPYIEYKKKIEFGQDEYEVIDHYCRAQGIQWFASCWDRTAVNFIEQFEPVCYKIASASLTDDALLEQIRSTGRPIVLSSGMSTMDEIRHAVGLLNQDKLLLAHSTSAYPCKPKELNLRVIETLREEFSVPVGYSGHEVGLQTTLAAVTIGATFVERHITLDRAMWGTDQAASIEPQGLSRLVRDIRVIETALGDGVKRVYQSEMPARNKLRRFIG
jgi:sialic acid synthase SpsE